MRGLVADGEGSPTELRPRELEAPEPGEGEVVLRVVAAAVNRSDLLNVTGMPITTYPVIPGRDFAGTVVDGPEELVGGSFWGTGGGELGFTRDGSHAELLALPAGALLPLPSTFSLGQAGCAGLSYLMAEHGLAASGLRGGGNQTVLVTGAAGGVGSAAIAIARWRGADVIAAVLDRHERDAVLAAHPGTTVVISDERPLPEAVREETVGLGADIVFDTVGNPVFAGAVASLGTGGRMVAITGAPGNVPFDLFAFYRTGGAILTANSTAGNAVWAASLLRNLAPGFESGALPPPRIAEQMPLDRAAEAYLAVQEGRLGRVLIRVGE